MSPDTEKWLDKVQKLLNQAEGKGTTPDEAEAFAAKAEEIMIRHAIDEAMLATHNGKTVQDEIIRERVYFKGIFSTADRDLANAVGHALGFKTLQGKVGTQHHATWIGFKREIEDAKVLVASLLIQSRRALEPQTRTWKNYGYNKQELYVARRSFIDAFGRTAGRRIAETRQRITDEVAASDGSLLPVLASRESQLDAALASMYPDLKPARRSRSRYDFAGAAAGMQAAERADIGQPKIAGRKAIER